MPMVRILSDAQVALIKRLIEFAEDNDFFEFEFEDHEQEKQYRQLWAVAEKLYEELSVAEAINQGPTASTDGVNIEQPLVLEDGKPWWDISIVRLGLKRAQLRKQLQQLRDRLKALILHSDSLEVRQAMLEAVYALQSTEKYFGV